MEILWELRSHLPTDESPDALHDRYQRHNRLYLAIRDRDVHMARFYLADHFREAYDDMLRGIEPPSAVPGGESHDDA